MAGGDFGANLWTNIARKRGHNYHARFCLLIVSRLLSPQSAFLIYLFRFGRLRKRGADCRLAIAEARRGGDCRLVSDR
nr:hypothetical protein Iba_chr07dCG4280 [Ipomoea batatas]